MNCPYLDIQILNMVKAPPIYSLDATPTIANSEAAGIASQGFKVIVHDHITDRIFEFEISRKKYDDQKLLEVVFQEVLNNIYGKASKNN